MLVKAESSAYKASILPASCSAKLAGKLTQTLENQNYQTLTTRRITVFSNGFAAGPSEVFADVHKKAR